MSWTNLCTQVTVPILRSNFHPNVDRTITLDKVPFEALLYFASRQREKEEERFVAGGGVTSSPGIADSVPGLSAIIQLFSTKEKKNEVRAAQATPEKGDTEKDAASHQSSTREELRHANRALRTATWLSIFYLITTELR